MSKHTVLNLLAACALLSAACNKSTETKPAEEAAAAPAADAPAADAAAAPAGDHAAPADAAPAAAAAATGLIEGKVLFAGTAPPKKPLKRQADPFCAKSEAFDESAVVNANGTLANVIVRITKGADGTYPAATTIAEVHQTDCMYRPRVQAIMSGQPVEILNGDQTLHNVHTYNGKKTVFNKAMPPGSGNLKETFSDGYAVLAFKCDVHPWMAGYVALSPNPFSAVSGDDGSFKIAGLPAGTYTLEAWHEKFGLKTADVTVKDGEPAKVEFSYTGTEKASAELMTDAETLALN